MVKLKKSEREAKNKTADSKVNNICTSTLGTLSSVYHFNSLLTVTMMRFRPQYWFYSSLCMHTNITYNFSVRNAFSGFQLNNCWVIIRRNIYFHHLTRSCNSIGHWSIANVTSQYWLVNCTSFFHSKPTQWFRFSGILNYSGSMRLNFFENIY